MKRLLTWGIGLIAVVVLAGVGTLYLAPGFVVSTTQSMAARSAGLTAKTVMVDGYETHYFEGGAGPTLVMLHGMADDRHSFVGAAAELTDSYHVILPDLMGHGSNVADPARDYSIAGHKAFISAFFDTIGLETFILVGNSMGGHTSATYTLDNPEKVDRLILVNAPGLVVDDTVVYGGFGAPIETAEEFDAIMARVLHNPPSVPGPVKQYLIETTNARIDFINGLAESVKAGDDFDLSPKINNLAVPTLVLWGEEDVVVPFAVAEAYAERIPDAQLVLLQEAGHSPQMEAPVRVADAIRMFLNEN